jgi:hypothetical protein
VHLIEAPQFQILRRSNPEELVKSPQEAAFRHIGRLAKMLDVPILSTVRSDECERSVREAVETAHLE